MFPEEAAVLVLLFFPALLFAFFFHRSFREIGFIRCGVFAFLGGAFSTIPLKWLIYPFFGFLLNEDLRSLISASTSVWIKALACLGVVGPVEEFVKLFCILVIIFLFNLEKKPKCVFFTFMASGLGFAFAENLDYYKNYGFEVLAMRGFLTSAGHLIFSGTVGVFLAKALPDAFEPISGKVFRGFSKILLGLMCASALHGLFDLFAFCFSAFQLLAFFFFLLSFGFYFLRESWIFFLRLEKSENLLPEK
ncbi:PrsW family intramembrane metalloprotease [bacterium]|nr:PrsW family intramembrane metalloprotease [bacterium]